MDNFYFYNEGPSEIAETETIHVTIVKDAQIMTDKFKITIKITQLTLLNLRT